MKIIKLILPLITLVHTVFNLKVTLRQNRDSDSISPEVIFLQIRNLKSNNATINKTEPAAEKPKIQTNSTNTTNSTNNTSNVVGTQKAASWVDKEPIKVKRCDQVVMFEGNRIKDFDDYSKKESAFFTMSAYMINMFNKKDAGKLAESINLSHIKIMPQNIPGALYCLGFLDSVTTRNITVCLKSQDSVNQIETAYQNFMKCRMGQDLSQPDQQIINNIIQASCKQTATNSTEPALYDISKIKISVAEELRKNGFTVSEEKSGGTGQLSIIDSTVGSSQFKSKKLIDLKIPGTPESPRHNKNYKNRLHTPIY